MNIGFWNVRGVGKPNFLEEIQLIRKENNLNILALAETKTQQYPNIAKVRSAGFNDVFFIPSTGSRGGIWILWKHNDLSEKLTKSYSDDRCIIFSYSGNQSMFAIMFTYAPSVASEKGPFWRYIIDTIVNINLPILIIGDLNDIEYDT